jgi:hypothetical protein
MKKMAGLGLMLVTALLLAGCGGIVGNLTGGSSTAVGALWPDVPPLAGATRVDVDLPLPIKLLMQGYIKSASNDAANLDYIVVTTDKSPTDARDFYTAERMAGAGWTAEEYPGGCSGNSTLDADGVVCFFGRRDGARETILMILTGRDEASKKTQLFYVRMSVVGTPTP